MASGGKSTDDGESRESNGRACLSPILAVPARTSFLSGAANARGARTAFGRAAGGPFSVINPFSVIKFGASSASRHPHDQLPLN